ncbi:GlxA family transcriptional regulator [Trinickia acidisoli]|uniref:GlxA family transcriptional regulator n=1 Tax=Trinickia acidisoli TaxID=2767482 RepID=UPI001A902953|nr:helix-turn-helix domain-containing protein [Trinickia acidisoli]
MTLARSSPADPPVIAVVAVVAFGGISPFHLSVPCIVFGEDYGAGGVPRFDVRVCAAEPGMLRTTAGFAIAAPHGLEAIAAADIVIVPSWRDALEPPCEALIQALRAAHARGAQMVGLCLGAFVLAAAGILEGRLATTHWAWAETFACRFPAVRVDAAVLYVEDGNVLTSAGTAASLDCCLHLLRRRCGARAANYVARRLVVPPHRQGSQAQFVEQPLGIRARDERLSSLLDWVLENLGEPHSLDSLAQRALMSRRTFTRRFKLATGTTVGAWLLGARLSRAQQLLETTDDNVDVVAETAGFGSAVSLRQHFAEAFNTTPSNYRREFQGV